MTVFYWANDGIAVTAAAAMGTRDFHGAHKLQKSEAHERTVIAQTRDMCVIDYVNPGVAPMPWREQSQHDPSTAILLPNGAAILQPNSH